MPDTLAHADHTPFTDFHSLPNDSPTSYKRTLPNPYPAIHGGMRRNVAVIFDNHIVLDKRLTIDDAIAANSRAGIHDRSVHHD